MFPDYSLGNVSILLKSLLPYVNKVSHFIAVYLDLRPRCEICTLLFQGYCNEALREDDAPLFLSIRT